MRYRKWSQIPADEQLEIKREYEETPTTVENIAAEHGMSKNSLQSHAKRRQWKRHEREVEPGPRVLRVEPVDDLDVIAQSLDLVIEDIETNNRPDLILKSIQGLKKFISTISGILKEQVVDHREEQAGGLPRLHKGGYEQPDYRPRLWVTAQKIALDNEQFAKEFERVELDKARRKVNRDLRACTAPWPNTKAASDLAKIGEIIHSLGHAIHKTLDPQKLDQVRADAAAYQKGPSDNASVISTRVDATVMFRKLKQVYEARRKMTGLDRLPIGYYALKAPLELMREVKRLDFDPLGPAAKAWSIEVTKALRGAIDVSKT